MNPSGIQQTLGNICVGIAAILYAIPLQHLLRELSRKRDDGGALLAGLIILVPMWLLLLVGLLIVTSSGGFSWIRINRTMLYAAVVLATLMMAIVSLTRFEFPKNAGFVDFLIGGLPIYVLPVLTMLVVVASLNPRFAMGLSQQTVTMPWVVLASLSLLGAAGLVGYKVVSGGVGQIAAIGQVFGNNNRLTQENLATIPTLDTQRDFTELVRLSSRFQSKPVREAAVARLRTSPEFIANLTAQLANATASSGEAEHALNLLEFAEFSPQELQTLAAPARSAMQRITDYAKSEMRYMPKDRKNGMRSEVGRLYKQLATKLSGTGVDFGETLSSFDRVFGN